MTLILEPTATTYAIKPFKSGISCPKCLSGKDRYSDTMATDGKTCTCRNCGHTQAHGPHQYPKMGKLALGSFLQWWVEDHGPDNLQYIADCVAICADKGWLDVRVVCVVQCGPACTTIELRGMVDNQLSIGKWHADDSITDAKWAADPTVPHGQKYYRDEWDTLLRRAVVGTLGVDIDDLIDYDWDNYYEDGFGPQEAVNEAFKSGDLD